MLSCFSVLIIHRSLTWTAVYLTCVCDIFACLYTHTAVGEGVGRGYSVVRWFYCSIGTKAGALSESHRCFLHTGKTILLVLQGLRWARQGRDVDVVSIDPNTLAASLMIQHQLQVTLSADSTTSLTPGTVRLRQYDFLRHESDVDRAVKDLLSVVQGDTLCVLVDEASDLDSER